MEATRQVRDRILGRSYEELVVLALSGITTVFTLTFSIVRTATGQWLHVAVDLGTLALAVFVWLYVWRTGRTAVAAPLWGIALIALLVGTVETFGARMLFWAYPLMAAAFFLMRPSWALGLNVAAGVAVAPQALAFGTELALLGLYPSLAATSLLALSIVFALERNRAELRSIAERDALTGLANRYLLDQRLAQLIANAGGKRSVAVLMLDVDNFKVANDTLGHSTGDELLREIGRRLRGCVAGEDLVARFGGDEFVIALAIDDRERISRVIERIRAAVTPPFAAGQQQIELRATIGIAVYPDHGASADALVQAADTAMYTAKHGGKDRHAYFDAAMNEELAAQLGIEAELRAALDREQLLLYFQPRFAFSSGAVIGAEGLVRWNHPDRGILTPGEFLPVAEQSSLIDAIDEVVLRQAAAQAAAWRRAGCALTVSVNISARELHSAGFGRKVARALAGARAEPHDIEIEITETVVLRDVAGAVEQLDEMRRCAPGLRIALDDFGTGYSSLQYLRRLPIDTLKIDRSFIADLSAEAGGGKAREIAGTIVQLGHKLALRIVAEGVETAEQAELLQALGCDEVQGFWFARPMARNEFEAYLASMITAEAGG